MKRFKKVLSIIMIIGIVLPLVPSIKVDAKLPGTYTGEVISICHTLSRAWDDINNGCKQFELYDDLANNSAILFYPKDSSEVDRPVQFNGGTSAKKEGRFKNLGSIPAPDSTQDAKAGFKAVLSSLQYSDTEGDNNTKIDLNATFGVTSFDSELDAYTGSSLNKVYSVIGNASNYLRYTGCDYDTNKDEFVYYFIYAENHNLDSSDFCTVIFRSEMFYCYDGNGLDEQIGNNLFDMMHDLINYGGGNAIATALRRRDGSNEGVIERWNNIYRYSGPAANNDINIEIRPKGSFSTNNTGSKTYPALYAEVEHQLISKTLETGVFIDEWVEGGSGEHKSNVQSLFQDICDVAKGYAKKDFENLQDAHIGGDGDLSYELVKLLGDAILEAVKQSWTDDAISTTINETDPFMIMQEVLRINIIEMCDGKSWGNGMTEAVQLPDGIMQLSANGQRKSDVGEVTYTVKDMWDKLNDYQRAVLTMEYASKLKVIRSAMSYSDVQSARYTFISSVDYKTSAELPYFDMAEVTADVNDWVLEGIDATPSVTSVSRNCSVLAEYIIGTSLFSANGSGENEDIFDLYNADLEQLGVAVWDWEGYEEVAQLNHFSTMPKNIGLFGEQDSAGYSNFGPPIDSWNRVVALLFNVEYGFEVYMNSAYGVSKGGDPKVLQQFLNGQNVQSTTPTEGGFSWMTNSGGLDAYESLAIDMDFSGDTVSIGLLRSIIELHDMCVFLKIKPEDWPGAIQTYLEIYTEHEAFFTVLRNNPNIYSKAEVGIMSNTEPLGKFFSVETRKTSDQWNKGFALSALYVPMETNLYDANSVVFLNDPDWISDFYYKYAFYRKAVYVNTDSSAIVNKAVTSTDSSGVKVCTLRDLINYDRDIILTVDDNFYNANQVADIISKVDYAAVRNVGGDATSEDTLEVYDDWTEKFGNWASGLFDLDAESILKTGATKYYSQNLAEKVTQLGADSSILSSPYDAYLLSDVEILGDEQNNMRSVLDDYEYSVKQSYGVVSAIYKNADLYNECLRGITTDNAIFKSSIDICKTPGTKEKDWRSIYNYYMLANLESQMKNDTSSTLDLDAPIFCDLFGNIITESGLVIIPAACNATLCGENWDPYTIGWSEYYNNGNRILAEGLLDDVYTWLLGREYHGSAMMSGSEDFMDFQNVSKNKAGGFFSIDNSEVLVLRDVELTLNGLSGVIQFEMPNKNSAVVKQLFYSDAYTKKCESIYSLTISNMIVEVLRGAPIENIDYTYESLDGNMHISKYGVYMAYKLEELMNSLISGTNGNSFGGNSVVTMPNLAFISGIEYVVLYVFKIVFALLIVGLVVQLYLDATKNSLGLKSVLHFIFTCVLLLVSFTLIPKLINWSYYKANKDLLADEAGYIMMLNYSKEFDGSEIGITQITTPETQSELYIQVSDIKPKWWEIIPDVLFGNTYQTVTDMYVKSLENDALAHQEYVQMKGDGLYVDVQDIFNSTNLMYTPSTNMIINYSTALEGRKDILTEIDELHNEYTDGTLPNIGSSGGQITEEFDEYGNLIGWTTSDDEYTTENVDTDSIRNQTDIRVDANGNEYNTPSWSVDVNDRDSVTSFVIPYYVILDQLVGNINEYNVSRGITAYSWGVGSNGHILTYDILTPYLTSSEFLEDGYDILGLQQIIGVEAPQPLYNRVIGYEDELRIQESLWYPTGLTSGMKSAKLDELYDYARDYIADNRYVIGKVPDEVFIKVFAMQLAIKYNEIFNISQGGAVEIINVDTRDLMRFMVGDKPNVYKYYSYSFARYCYEEGGSVGTVFAALLTVIFWLTSFLKPLAMIIILALLAINVVLRKLLFHKESRCIEGYMIGSACLVMCNYLYALLLKVSMIITDLGLGTVTAMVVAFVVQILYVAGLACIVSIEIKDWKNSGFGEFQSIGANITSGVLHAKSVLFDKLISRNNEAYREVASQNKYIDRDYGRSVDSMIERDMQREQNAIDADD